MEPSTIWWVLAGITVAAELLIGSFYLLMLSLGMAAGAIAAQGGSPLTVQLVVAAGVGGAAVLLWRRIKQGRGAELEANAKAQYPVAIGAALAEIAATPAVLHAYEALHELAELRPHRTVRFHGFADNELRAVDAAMLEQQLDAAQGTTRS